MRPERASWVLGTLVGLVCVGAGGAIRADEPPSDQMLQKHGLKRSGPVFILEAEAPVLEKAAEVKDLSQKLKNAIAKQRATVSEKEYQETIKGLTDELNALRAQSNAVTQNINRIPKRRGYPIYIQEYNELTYYRNQLQSEINQQTAYLNQIKSQPFDPKGRAKADAEVQSSKDALRQGAQELRKLVDEVRAKYAETEKDPQVKKWLGTPEGPAGVKPKMGPSHTFVLNEKMLERVEKDTSSDDAFAPAQKATRKARRTTKAKRPSASGDTGSP